MGSIVYDKSMSLDGYIAGTNVRLDAGLGDDGERLHDWVFEDPAGRELVDAEVANLGAVICGRRTYDMSIRYWGADGPTGPARVPLFVVSHGVPDEVPGDGVYTFVHDIDTAFERAREVAGDRNVSVMGAETARQLLRTGRVDEIAVHIVPVLFGGGTRMFDEAVEEHIALEVVDVRTTSLATHIRYRVIR